jgi:NADPH-dependent curcumin reductase CurA
MADCNGVENRRIRRRSRAYVKAGKVTNKETGVKGIDQAPAAFIALLQGQNVGKMVVELA